MREMVPSSTAFPLEALYFESLAGVQNGGYRARFVSVSVSVSGVGDACAIAMSTSVARACVSPSWAKVRQGMEN